MVAQIFSHEADGCRVIYRLKKTEEIAEWIRHLRDGLCELLPPQKHRYKRQVISSIQEYIKSNVKKKLTLNSVAAAFNFSPNYLSHLFTKYTGESFVDYITGVRIAAAKEMLSRDGIRIYEVAEELGFESAFYFSKVFKKVEGISPREYLQRLENAEIKFTNKEN
jgi:two-component system response regulator YesN